MEPPIAPRPARLKRVLLSLLGLVALLAGVTALLAGTVRTAAQGYLFGYPLVIMDVTRANSLLAAGPENQLRRIRQFPDAAFRDVVRPNVDTLYTSAFIDLAQGPLVFEMAANEQRYELMPFMDGWTNVFAAPGTRATGKGGGSFLLAGPVWQGAVPAGLTLLRSPTQLAWLIGRTQTNGVADYATVHRIQDGLKLRTLADWQAGRDAPASDWKPAPVRPQPPVAQMQSMGTEAFFTRLARLMVANPPASADAAMLDRLARIGVRPGQPLDWGVLDRLGAGLGRWLAERTVARALKKPGDLVRGWSTPPAVLGNYGTDYNTRAVVAMVGLGANLPADATYPNARVDATGQALDGSHRYRIHFKATELPPVNAFWSVTAYGADDFLIDNPLNRYALGDRDPLVFNPDGSLDLLIQSEPVQGAMANNWLPVRAGSAFLLNARLYWPKQAALDGSWGMPAIERLD